MIHQNSKTQHQMHHSRKVRRAESRVNAIRPSVAYRQRGNIAASRSSDFSAPEVWYEPTEASAIQYIEQSPGLNHFHPVKVDEVRMRIAELPAEFTERIRVVQLSSMTRKRSLFPLYGMQWGPNIYLYPMDASLIETFRRPPTPAQRIEARMYGGTWSQIGTTWRLTWTRESIRDFYLNNVLIHEIGHVNDDRNSNPAARERFANWFATEFGYRASRNRR